MSDKQPDRRPAKTRKSLGAALYQLMQQTAWDDITIKQVCDEANVARSSFYAHFDGKLDLLEAMIDGNLKAARAECLEPASPQALLIWLIDHVSENRTLFFRVAAANAASPVMNRFRTAFLVQFMQELRAAGHDVPEYSAAFVVGGTFEALQSWAKSWRRETLPDLKSDVARMMQMMLAER